MLTFEKIRQGITHWRNEPFLPPLEASKKGLTVHVLEKICGGKRGRYIVMMWLFPDLFPSLDETTTKKLSTEDWWALFRFVAPERMDKGNYIWRKGLEEECAAIWLDQAQKIGEMTEIPVQSAQV